MRETTNIVKADEALQKKILRKLKELHKVNEWRGGDVGIDSLAMALHLDVEHINNSLQELERDGYVTIIPLTYFSRNHHLSNYGRVKINEQMYFG